MKKNIVFFSHASKLYGAPRSMLILADALKEKYNVSIVTYGYGGLVEEAERSKIPVYIADKSIKRFRNLKSRNYFLRAARFILRMLDMVKLVWVVHNKNADLLYINTVANHRPVFLAKLLGIKKIVHVRESESYIFPADNKRDKSIRYILNNSEYFICVSKSIECLVKKRLLGLGNSASLVSHVYNGIDFDGFVRESGGSSLDEVCLPKGKKVVGYLGNINKRKGLDIFIDAAKIVLKIRNDVVFLVVGGDAHSFASVLDESSVSNSERESIHYQSFTNKPQAAFELFDVYCMTSLAEPFARVNLEAACMGVPVIATAIHGNKEFFEDGISGILVEPGNSTQLASKMEMLIDDDALAENLAKNSRKKVIEKFSIEKYVDGCENFINKVL